jgi:hypothetical protein
MTKDNRTNNDLQNTPQNTKDRPMKTGVNTGVPEGYSVPVPHLAPVVVLLLQTR